MAIKNFSDENQKVYNLMLDLARCQYASHVDKEGVSRKDLEDHLRETIKNDILGGATLYQAYRRNKNVIFEMIEEIVNIVIGDDVLSSPFIENFVEVKRRDLGDNTAWYSEGTGYLTVAEFAGNHWDTNRQAIDLGSEYSLPKTWVYVHVYEELERFLLGIITFDKMTDVLYKSFNKYIKDRIYVSFAALKNAAPTEFVKQGNSEDAVGGLVDLVRAVGGYSNITIAGTRGALRKLKAVIPEKTFADSQKEANAQDGSIGYWEGNKIMVIEQTVQPGTMKLALDDSVLYILGGDSKPIKLEYFGDSRTLEDTTGKVNNDMSIDLQVQTKLGLGVAAPAVFGVFTFAGN